MFISIGRYFGRYGYRILVGLVLTTLFALHAARITEIPLVGQLENMAYDLRLQSTMPGTVDRRVVIVDIDEKSLAVEGRWPWSRARIADLVDNLFEHYDARTVGFDIVFAEPERLDHLDRLLDLANAAGRTDVIDFVSRVGEHPDVLLARSVANRDVVLSYYFSYGRSEQGGRSGALPEPLLPAEIAGMLSIPAPAAYGYGGNLQLLQSAARSGGFFDNPLDDSDGVFRRIPLVQQYEGGLYASLALAVSEVALGTQVEFSDANDAIHLDDIVVPVDQDMAALIPYRGRQGSFPYVSAADVLDRSADPAVLEDAIVLVGTTAPGLFDLRNTPVQKIYPGVEIHANVISGILDNRFLARPDYTLVLEMIQIIVIGVLLSLILPTLGPTRGSWLTLAFLVFTVALNGYLWVFQSSVVPITSALLLIVLHYVYITSYGFLVESRTRQALKVQFGRYVPGEIVEKMSRNPEHYSLEGERRDLTVMFSDIRGFTSLSEKLEPGEVTLLMNVYLSRMTELIHRNHGTIDKYIGDAIMAFWGAPLEDPEHAAHAIETALKMRDVMPSIQEEFAARGWPPIRIGVGINSGIMAVGNMGSSFRMAYTVMGDAVNIGSRVESLTKMYGATVIVTRAAADKAPEFRYRFLDRVKVRGRAEPLDIVEPLAIHDQVSPDQDREVREFDAFLEAYRSQRFSDALAMLKDLDRNWGEKPLHGIYRARIIEFSDHGIPSDFDGAVDLGG